MCEPLVFEQNQRDEVCLRKEASLPAQSGETGKGDSAPLVVTPWDAQTKRIHSDKGMAPSLQADRKGGQRMPYVQLTSSAEGSRARTLALPDAGQGFLAPDPASGGSLTESLARYGPPGFSSRMFPDSLVPTGETILRSSSQRWESAGMGTPTEYWTQDISESPRDAVESTLSDILVDAATIPQRYYLSPKAAAGILRRAESRGKELPEVLETALRFLAAEHGKGQTIKPTSVKSPTPSPNENTKALASEKA